MLSGTVKVFGGAKGFGFITCDQVAGDVYFQDRDLPAEAQGGLFPIVGCTAHFELQHTADGKPQAKNLQVELTEQAAGGAADGGAAEFGGGAEQTVVGEVKSFNDEKGFGFIASPYLEGDVYFQRRDVPPHLQGMPVVGAKVGFTTHTTPDGKLQARGLQFSQMGGGQMGGQKGGMGMGMGGCGAAMKGGKGGINLALGNGGGGMMGKGAGGMMGKGCGGVAGKGCGGMKGGPPAEGATVVGMVKSVDPTKGYGFISVPGFPTDVYFKPDQPMESGMTVSFAVKWTPDGKAQARNVVPALGGGEMLVGTVKSFSERNGYGFLGSADSPQDVYFQRQNLPEELQTGDVTGATVRFSVHLKPDGKPQAQEIAMVSSAPQGMKRPGAGAGFGEAAWGGGAIMPEKRARPEFAGGAAMGDGMGGAAGQAEGVIKTFNAQKGFGFIESPGVQGDVFFKNTMLPAHLQQAPLTGAQVTFDLRYTQDGKPQAGNMVLEGM